MHSSNYLRSWNFEGSNDDNNWTIIRQHRNDTSLNKQYATFTWDVSNCITSYRMFRLHMIGRNAELSAVHYHIMCHGFEIYGHLVGNK